MIPWLQNIYSEVAESLPFGKNDLAILVTLSIGVGGWISNAYFSLRSAKRSRISAQVLKQVDVTIHCYSRYDLLTKMREDIINSRRKLDRELSNSELLKQKGSETQKKNFAEKLDEIAIETNRYFDRFWGLKSDQFDFWLTGVLDHDTFFDWTYYLVTKISHEERSALAPIGKKLQTSWQEWTSIESGTNRAGANPEFQKFTDNMFTMTSYLLSGTDVELRHEGVHEAAYVKALTKAILDEMERVDASVGENYRNDQWSGKLKLSKYRKYAMRPFESSNGWSFERLYWWR